MASLTTPRLRQAAEEMIRLATGRGLPGEALSARTHPPIRRRLLCALRLWRASHAQSDDARRVLSSALRLWTLRLLGRCDLPLISHDLP